MKKESNYKQQTALGSAAVSCGVTLRVLPVLLHM